jgi:hypothetical protein
LWNESFFSAPQLKRIPLGGSLVIGSMNAPLCGLPFLVAFGAYGVAGIVLSVRMLREGIGGKTPAGFAMYRPESYTPEGQRLLAVFRKWYGPRLFFVALGLAVAGGLVCNLVGW